MNFRNECIYVYNRRPQYFDCILPIGELLCLKSGDSSLDFGTIKTRDSIYACLVYDHCRVITLITAGSYSDVICLIFRDDEDYSAALQLMKSDFSMKISKQDGKLISYARSISEKLLSGIEVAVFDAVDEDDFIVCPACGVQNAKDSGFPFCLECGEPL